MRRDVLIESNSGLLCKEQWQLEFYLAGSSILPSPLLLSPDMGADLEKKEKREGFIDFYVSAPLKWSIDIACEADRIEEHLGRYVLAGKYVPYLKAVLNFIDLFVLTYFR